MGINRRQVITSLRYEGITLEEYRRLEALADGPLTGDIFGSKAHQRSRTATSSGPPE